jgi:hypothetical protein
MTTTHFDVNGLRSDREAERLARSLAGLDGVTHAHVHAGTGRVILTGRPDSTAAERAARAAVRTAGYEIASDFGPSRSRRA